MDAQNQNDVPATTSQPSDPPAVTQADHPTALEPPPTSAFSGDKQATDNTGGLGKPPAAAAGTMNGIGASGHNSEAEEEDDELGLELEREMNRAIAVGGGGGGSRRGSREASGMPGFLGSEGFVLEGELEEEVQERARVVDRDDGQRGAAEMAKRKQIVALMGTMNEEQLSRFEAFRRSTLSRANMRKLMLALGYRQNDEKILIVVCSMAKMFVGDVIEKARCIANGYEHSGALLRYHIHRAYQELMNEGCVPSARIKKRKFGHL